MSDEQTMSGIEIIHRAVVERLTENGCRVEAAEVTEGFLKPSYFVEVDYSEVSVSSPYWDDVTYKVSIQYIPKTETKHEIIKVQQKMREMFLRSPLRTEFGVLCIHTLHFDTAYFPSLVTTFEIELTEEVIDDEQHEEMRDLEIGGI